MSFIIYLIPCIVLSELAFLLGYFLTYTISRFMELALVALLKRRLSASIMGVLCGAAGGFCALAVAYIFVRLGGAADSWLLIVSVLLPAVGLFAYFEKLFRQVATGYARIIPLYGRLHAAMMAIPQRIQFEVAKMLLEQGHPEQAGLEDDHVGREAYQQT
jgi:hypothetical protein